MKLIVGLGNPGSEYEKTRHNLGFMALDEIKSTYELPDFKINKKLQGEVSKGKINKSVVTLLKPTTFMNESGISVAAALSFLKISSKDLVVVHDDKDIPLGETRVQTGRGDAGHNGVKSIIEKIGGNEFTRIRIGIAPEKKITSTADFVLHRLSAEEEKKLTTVFKNISEEIVGLLQTRA